MADVITITIERNDLAALRDALAAALAPAKPRTAAAAVYSAPKFVRSVNLLNIHDGQTSAYLREAWAVVNGLDEIPKSTGKFHNRTLLADELNRRVRNMTPEQLAALA